MSHFCMLFGEKFCEMQGDSIFSFVYYIISVIYGYFNVFLCILLYFVTYATLLQIWYCQKLRTF